MAYLYEKKWLDQHSSELADWQQDAYKQFHALLLNKEQAFPCVPAQRGYLSNHLRFGLVGNPTEEAGIYNLAEILKAYGACSRDTGKFASLVVFFQTPEETFGEFSIKDYETFFWSTLQRLHQLDEKEWPGNISTDPHDPTWEFSFDGEPYFVFSATPAHLLRKSRHFTHFMLAFQPRWVFEEINDSTSFGRRIKNVIRHRLEKYDEVPPHPALKWYGEKDNLEWKQYFLREDTTTRSRCPFTYMKEKIKKLGQGETN